jgi:thioredoxin 1
MSSENEMNNTLSRRALLAASTLLVSPGAFAQTSSDGHVKFSQSAFDAAQAAGKSIVVEITAPWCPVCKVQKSEISTLMAKPVYSGVMILDVDFDNQKDIVSKFGARSQSTLIAFKGKTEMRRLVGETKPEVIEDLVKSTI